ncbi:MAG: oligosaccharide flippase family protein [Deltaproteobacteria bacterium]|jgi:O-antigen/teichoic acid export membrane protein
MRRRAIRGSVVAAGGQGVSMVLRFASNWMVAQLLLPDMLGLAGTVNAVVLGLQMISDIGVHQNIVQHERDDDAFTDTAFSVSLLRGILLFLMGCALAYPAAWWYERPELAALLPFTALSALLNSAMPTKYARLSRDMELVRLTLLNLGSHAIGIAVMVAYAYVFRSVWALVLGAVVTAGAKWFLSVVAIPGRMNRFAWEPEAVRDLINFGKWVFLSTLLMYVSRHFDQLVIPKLENMGVAGVYGIAVSLAMTPLFLGGAVIGQVLFPALAESKRVDAETFQRRFDKARNVMLPLHIYVCAGVALGSAPLIRIYKPVYADAAWMCQLLTLSMWFQYLQEAWTQALVAVGDTRSQAISNAVRVVIMVPLILIGFEVAEVPGLILGGALGAISGYAVVGWRIRRLGLRVFGPDTKAFFVFVILAGGGAYAPYVIAEQTGVDALWPQLGIGGAIGVALSAYLYVKVLPRLRGSAA